MATYRTAALSIGNGSPVRVSRTLSAGSVFSSVAPPISPLSSTPTPIVPQTTPMPSTQGGGSILDQLGRAGVQIATDYIRSKLIPGQTSAQNPASTVPGPSTNLAVPQSCPDGTTSILGRCVDLQPGGATQGGGVMLSYGEAVMGRYGPALVPAQAATVIRRCPRGAVLGNDGLCYNRKDLAKRDRMHIPARKPLLTGGDLNAISRANRAANKLKAQQKRLQQMGMLPKPTRARRGPAVHARAQLAPGITVVDT